MYRFMTRLCVALLACLALGALSSPVRADLQYNEFVGVRPDYSIDVTWTTSPTYPSGSTNWAWSTQLKMKIWYVWFGQHSSGETNLLYQRTMGGPSATITMNHAWNGHPSTYVMDDVPSIIGLDYIYYQFFIDSATYFRLNNVDDSSHDSWYSPVYYEYY